MLLRRIALGALSLLLSLAATAPVASAAEPVKLDVLFIGAHPDDETFAIPTFGQWGEFAGVKSGVLTVTRGEGGGNAVGPEEGIALGLLREAEERRAVAFGGVSDIFYLDDVDFFYTVSAPLTGQLWGHDRSLERVVRLIRETRPEVILTMNPSPTPGNHGNHQYAARLAVEGYYAAADPKAFPDQVKREGLRPWAVKRVLQQNLATVGPDAVAQTLTAGIGVQPPATGEDECARADGLDATDVVFNVWRGRVSQQSGRPWALTGAAAANEYASQGFSGATAAALGALFFAFCDQYSQIAARAPVTLPVRGDTAVFEGITRAAEGGLPEGSLFYARPRRFRVVAGVAVKVDVFARSGDGALGAATAALSAPDGWKVAGTGALGAVDTAHLRRTTFTLTPPAGTLPGRVRLSATLAAGRITASSVSALEVVPAVTGALKPLAHVGEFRAWARRYAPQLDGLIKDRQAIGVGETRRLSITLTNEGVRTESGKVALDLPDGFTAEPASSPTPAFARVEGEPFASASPTPTPGWRRRATAGPMATTTSPSRPRARRVRASRPRR